MNIGRNFILIALFALLGNVSFSQCSPNPIFASTGIPGIFVDLPDLTLPNGFVGLAYNERLTVVVITDTTIDLSDALGIPGLPTLPALPVNFMKMNSVSGVPPGMAAICDSSDCAWDPGTIGCIGVTGTPTTPGTYTIEFEVVMNVQLPELPAPLDILGGIPLDLPIVLGTTHEITIGGVGVEEELDPNRFSSVQNVPNPATGNTRIDFSVPSPAEVSFTLMNMHGAVVATESIHADAGTNSLNINVESLSDGVYIYRLNDGVSSISNKLVVVK